MAMIHTFAVAAQRMEHPLRPIAPSHGARTERARSSSKRSTPFDSTIAASDSAKALPCVANRYWVACIPSILVRHPQARQAEPRCQPGCESYAGRILVACCPFGPLATSNVTRWFSLSVLNPAS